MKIQSKNNLKHCFPISPLSIPMLFVQSPTIWDSGEMLPSPAGRVRAELSQPPMGRGGNMRLAASGSCVSEQLLFSAATSLEGKMWPRTSTWRLFHDTLGHWGPHNMESRTNQNTKWGGKTRGRQRLRGNHCFIINVSYNLASFRMSSVNNLYKASPLLQ